ncbi:MAG: hypothetical protein IJ759_01015 [Bacteroidales bacterium]|nr:hypothetical protein [Bacteroidales bacterium]
MNGINRHIYTTYKIKLPESAARAGMGVQEFANHVLANKENYSSTQIKRANFAKNAAGWKHAEGGNLYYDGGPYGDNPPTYNLGLPLATGFDAFGRSVYTEEDRKRDEEFKQIQRNIDKQNAQKLMRNNQITPVTSGNFTTDVYHANERQNIDAFLKDYYQSEGFKEKVAKFDDPTTYLTASKKYLEQGTNANNKADLTFLYTDVDYNTGFIPTNGAIQYNPNDEKALNTDFSTVYAHERGHSLDPNPKTKGYGAKNNNIFGLKYAPSKDVLNLLLNYKFNNESTRDRLGLTEKDIENKKFFSGPKTLIGDLIFPGPERHDRDYKEIYADYISNIYNLYKLGIWDARDTKPFTNEHYKKYKSIYKNKGKWNRLFENTDKNTFIGIMNTFANNDSYKRDINNSLELDLI